MKKTLAAVAVLGAFAGSALAADVQLYGIVDTGLRYTHFDADSSAAGYDATDSFEMKSGQQSGSRFGFKGTEDLGNGLTVGFILENQFNSDDGSLADDDHFFRREATLFLQGGFGKVAFGRMGSINGGTSSWAKYGVLSAFGTSWDYTAQAGSWAIGGGMWDNMIAYETPDFAGFKVFAQYGMGNSVNDASVENESSSDRYYAIGATYNNGPFAGYFAVDSINYQTSGLEFDDKYIDDSLTVTLGGSWNFEVAKVYFGAQYFDEVKLSSIGGITKTTVSDVNLSKLDKLLPDITVGALVKVKGYGISLTADAPVAGGKAMFGVGYVDAEAADSIQDALKDNNADADLDLKRYVVSVGYDYPFSKRTDVYAVASYMQDQVDAKLNGSSEDWDPSAYTLYVGLRHKF